MANKCENRFKINNKDRLKYIQVDNKEIQGYLNPQIIHYIKQVCPYIVQNINRFKIIFEKQPM